jgi:two-component system chemotaxis sensor kinase CheA
MLSDDEIMRQVLAAFQEEQSEHCQAIGTILLDLERDPNPSNLDEQVTQLFREAHSLKGGARAAGLEAVEQIAHRIEDLFSAVRQGKMQITSELCDPIYAALEAITTIMGQVSAGQTATIEPYQPIMASLGMLLESGEDRAPAQQETASEPEHTAEAPASADDAEESAALPAESGAQVVERRERRSGGGRRKEDREQVNAASAEHGTEAGTAVRTAGEEVPWEMASATVRLSTATLDSLMNETGELIISTARAQQQSRDARAIADIPVAWRRIWRQIHPIMKRLQEQQPELMPTVHHLQDRVDNLSLRMATIATDSRAHYDTVVLLDALSQAQTMIANLEQRLADHARSMSEDAARLSAVTTRLQDQIRRTRMLPLAALFNPLRVQLREMTRAAGKQVVLNIDDGGAEADRQVLEGLREVLLHLLRNAIDHGIESPEARTTSGKAEAGRLTLRAVVSGDYLSLTVADDGAGLNLDAITQKALAQGLLSEADLGRVTEADLMDLVFLPGFSTRQTVDRMSGRGVGLDIVRSSVERMHGQVSVQSVPGAGCLFAIRVPLSLTSSHGLLLGIGNATYMLPLESIQRIVPVAPRDIQIVEGHAALTLDDHPITLIHLADLLNETRHAAGKHTIGQNGNTSGLSLALLLGSGDRQVACMVDSVMGEQELVVHRLPAPLQRVRYIAGATMLADGQVVPILDLVDVLRAAIGTRGMIAVASEPETAQRTPTVVVADDSITTRTLEKNILEAAGYRVHLATDGAEAIQVLHTLVDNGGCDLLLSDIDMPNLNGFDLTSQVRADPVLKHVPIVLVTSLDTASDRERGMAAGADAYIVKRAFDQQSLLDTIAQLI